MSEKAIEIPCIAIRADMRGLNVDKLPTIQKLKDLVDHGYKIIDTKSTYRSDGIVIVYTLEEVTNE